MPPNWRDTSKIATWIGCIWCSASPSIFWAPAHWRGFRIMCMIWFSSSLGQRPRGSAALFSFLGFNSQVVVNRYLFQKLPAEKNTGVSSSWQKKEKVPYWCRFWKRMWKQRKSEESHNWLKNVEESRRRRKNTGQRGLDQTSPNCGKIVVKKAKKVNSIQVSEFQCIWLKKMKDSPKIW